MQLTFEVSTSIVRIISLAIRTHNELAVNGSGKPFYL